MDGARFLTDPIFSQRASPLPFAGPQRLVAARRPARPRCRRVDFALLSHDHYDHTDLPAVRALAARGVRFVVPAGHGRARARRRAGTRSSWTGGRSAEVGGLRVHCVPAQHFSGPRAHSTATAGCGRASWSKGATRRFYHAGDTGYFGGFARDRERGSGPSTWRCSRSAPTCRAR